MTLIGAAAVLVGVSLAGLSPDPLLPGQPGALRGHTDVVTALAFHPDGGQLASAGRDGTLRLWSLEDGGAQVLQVPKGQVNALAFHPDGRTLALGNVDLQVKVLELETRREMHAITFPDAVLSVAFDPPLGLLGVAGASGTAVLYGLKDGRPKPTRVLGRTISFSGDGKTVCLSRKGGSIALADAASGRVRREITTAPHLPIAQLTSDGARIVSWNPGEYDVRLWNAKTGAPDGVLAGPRPTDVFEGARRPLLTSLAMTPDGKTVVTSTGDGQLQVWNVTTRQVERRFPLERHGVVAISADGATVAVADGTTIKVWSLRTPRTAAP